MLHAQLFCIWKKTDHFSFFPLKTSSKSPRFYFFVKGRSHQARDHIQNDGCVLDTSTLSLPSVFHTSHSQASFFTTDAEHLFLSLRCRISHLTRRAMGSDSLVLPMHGEWKEALSAAGHLCSISKQPSPKVTPGHYALTWCPLTQPRHIAVPHLQRREFKNPISPKWSI